MESLPFSFNYWFLQTLAMGVTAALIPKLRITSLFGALAAVVALAFVNAVAWDAALFFSIPNSLSTQTALLFLTNGAIFWVVVKLVPGIEVEGVFAALIAPVVFTFSSVLIYHYGREIDWVKVFDFTLQLLAQLRDYFKQVPPSPQP